MPASTRRSNKDATFKVYYSKKPPKQLLFPTRLKKVRRKLGHDEPVPDGRQTNLWDGQNTVEDSEDEDEDHVVVAGPSRKRRRTGSVLDKNLHSDGEELGALQEPKQKRRRASKAKDSNEKRRKTKPNTTPRTASEQLDPAEPGSRKDGQTESARRRARQSTMTQIVSGREINSEEEEPEFKPVKMQRRRSGKGKDKGQQTLTQMVPGLSFGSGIVSDSEEEGMDFEDDADVRSARQYDGTGDIDVMHVEEAGDVMQNEEILEAGVEPATESLSFEPIQLDEDDEDDDTYNPTQDVRVVKGKRTSTRRTLHRVPSQQSHGAADTVSDEKETRPTRRFQKPPRRPKKAVPKHCKMEKENVSPEADTPLDTSPKRRKSTLAEKTKLLTPRSRRQRIIPSSQSPSEGELSTQESPHVYNRSPMKERTVNDTPSKRKHVAFQEPGNDATIPHFRKFPSVIQDSEDEEEGSGAEDTVSGADIDFETQAVIQAMDRGVNVGPETQARIEEIDRACANADEDATLFRRPRSEELGDPINSGEHATNDEQSIRDETAEELQDDERVTVHEQHPSDDVEVQRGPISDSRSLDETEALIQNPSETVNEAASLQATPLDTSLQQSQPSSQIPPPSTRPEFDLDGEPINPLPVRHTQIHATATADQATQNTNTSHSNEAEAQLHTVYESYSIYKQTQSLSMHATADSHPSYQQTPHPLGPSGHHQQQQDFSPTQSQATTATQVSPRKTQTPRKTQVPSSTHATPHKSTTTLVRSSTSPTPTPRKPPTTTQVPASTHTTPHKPLFSSQPEATLTSPMRPPTLVIPSSVPPTPTARRAEIWGDDGAWSSSPSAMVRARGADESLDLEFSIPEGPPEVESEFEGDE